MTTPGALSRAATEQSDTRSLLDDLNARLIEGIEEMRRQGRDPLNAFRGLYIDDAEADHLASAIADERGLQPWWEVLQARLRHLGDLFDLEPSDTWIALAAVLPDLDLRYERVFAYLQDDVTRKRPTVDLLLQLLAPGLAERAALRHRFGSSGNLVRHSVVWLRDEGSDGIPPLLARAVHADERVVSFLLGSDAIDSRLAEFCVLENGSDSTFSAHRLAEITDRISAVAGSLAAGSPSRLVVIKGHAGAGKRGVATAIAKLLGLKLMVVETKGVLDSDLAARYSLALMRREAALQGAVCYWSGAALLWGEGDRQTAIRQGLLSSLPWSHPTLLGGPPDWPAPAVVAGAGTIPIALSAPGAVTRQAIWTSGIARQQVIVEDDVEGSLPELAVGFRLTQGLIEDAVSVAAAEAAGRGWPARLARRDLFAGARAVSSRALTDVAEEIHATVGWPDLVLPAGPARQLRELCDMVRGRTTVLDDWGFASRVSSGVGTTALFAGPSGTGKTLAAKVIAGELSLPIFRIDLARVVSKWIGETEKNLDRVFRAAEDSNAILFLDEADALLGKRSEIHDSHDRYANLEISYLLQKMELYDGVCIMATNMPQQMDEAFMRRLALTVFFPLPDQAQRLEIWKRLWPAGMPRAADVDLERLSLHKLTGGHIKNILLAAAYLAAADRTEVNMALIQHALGREYQKLGKHLSEADLRS